MSRPTYVATGRSRISGLSAWVCFVLLVPALAWSQASVHPAVWQHERDAQVGISRHAGTATPDLVSCFVQTNDPDALRREGVSVTSVVGDMAVVRFAPGRLGALARHKAVQGIYPDFYCEPHTDVVTANDALGGNYLGINSDALLEAGIDGSGVIVGVIDSGLDWEHPDFVLDGTEETNAPQSRILRLWDQTLIPVAGETAPADFPYGVEYTRTSMSLAMSTPPLSTVRTQDTSSGHGTHVTSIAAGDGSGAPDGRYRGVAPGADIVFVKTTFAESAILDACNYIIQAASNAGMPCVINLSLGNQVGSHDGRQPNGLGELIGELAGPGRLFVASTGNERNLTFSGNPQGLHSERVVTATAQLTYQQYNVSSTVQNNFIDIWYHAGDGYSVSLTAPGGSTSAVVPDGATLETVINSHNVTIMNAAGPTMTQSDGDRNIQIMVQRTLGLATGLWTINVTRTLSGGNGAMDMWFTSRGHGATWVDPAPTMRELISRPANGDNVIAVAAHATRNEWPLFNEPAPCYPANTLGALAPFSSPGPLRRESASNPNLLQAPDISAPGAAIVAALAETTALNDCLIAEGGRHRAQSGTSMATPVVSGALALLLSLQPNLTVDDVRRLFADTSAADPAARQDAATGATPNQDFGHGKLNVHGLLAPYLPTTVEAYRMY